MNDNTKPPPTDDEHERIVGDGVRRTVGIAAMRRMHRMIAAEKEAEARDARFVRVFGIGIALAAIAAVAWIALH